MGSAPPTLGALAQQLRYADARTVERCLAHQRQNYLDGDFRRLGEILVDHGHCDRGAVRKLLSRQGVSIVECTLCGTRYNALRFRGKGKCLRCRQPLRLSDDHAPLTVEDAVSGAGEQADALLAEHRQRNPRLGRYEVLGEVGRGSMGVIYKGWEQDLHRHVALKFLRPDGEGVTGEDRERFRREARAVAKLRHENIVQVHAIEEKGALAYLAMDFVAGVPLDRLLGEGLLSERRAVEAAAKIARALHYVHEQGVLHRDIKPGNIMIDRAGRPFVVDFGIAKSQTESQSLTTEGEILGSLAYMAPEYVIRGKSALDRRCDVYALGVVLYEALARGPLPYGEASDPDMILRVFKERPRPIDRVAPHVSAALAPVIMKAIAREPEERFPTAAAFAEALERLLEEGLLARERRPGGRPGGSGRRAAAAGSPERVPALDRTMPDARVLASPGAAAAPASKPSLPVRTGRLPLDPQTLLGAALAAVIAALGLAVAAGLLYRGARQDADGWQRRAGAAELRAGAAYEAALDLRAAEEAYGRAAEALPGDPEPLEARAAVRERLGEREAAAADREAAAALRAAEEEQQ